LRNPADQEAALLQATVFMMTHCGVDSCWAKVAQLVSAINSSHNFVMLCTLSTASEASAVFSISDPVACAASMPARLETVNQVVSGVVQASVALKAVAPILLAAMDKAATPELLAHTTSAIGVAQQQAQWAVEQATLAHRLSVYIDAAASMLASSLLSDGSLEQARLDAKAHAAGVIKKDAAGAAAEPAAVLELVVQMHTSLWNPVRHQLQLLQALQQQQQQEEEEEEAVQEPGHQGPPQQRQQQWQPWPFGTTEPLQQFARNVRDGLRPADDAVTLAVGVPM
jgi:hypothetical protein